MITSKSAYIQKYFVLCWYEVTNLSPLSCVHPPKENRAEQ